MSTDQLVAQYLEKLRLRLLDLSARNRLLNFKFSERSRTQIRLIDTQSNAVFEKLEAGNSLDILSLPEPLDRTLEEESDIFLLQLESMRDEAYKTRVKDQDEVDLDPDVFQKIEQELREKVRSELGMPSQEGRSLSKAEYAKSLGINTNYDLSASQSSLKDKKLQTLLYPEELESKLAGIRDGARKSIQETGLNTLYLAFGMLEWYESNNSDKCFFAPLLLYPVTLERQLRNGKYCYRIEKCGEEPEDNFSLRERLRNDFGILLPSFNDTDNAEENTSNTPESYFEKVRGLISDLSRWKVRHFLTLSLFYFGGVALFKDLNPDRWPSHASILQHPLITSIFCGQEDSPRNTIALDYEVDQPEVDHKVPLLITDADASQFSAIVDVLDDKNLVIEGPPGTGKSQTITNLIAATVAKGKTVLFVAEKKAALEVVYNRLANVGLENYCLEIHSASMSKQSFYEHLKQRVEQETPPEIINKLQVQIKECNQLKQKLSSYVEQLNFPYGQIKKTIQELLWSSQRSRDLIQDLSGLETLFDQQSVITNEADFQRKCEYLREFSQQYRQVIDLYDQVKNHPWFGIAVQNLSPIDQGDMLAYIKEWVSVLKKFQSFLPDITTLSSLTQFKQELETSPRFNSLIEVALLPILKTKQAQDDIKLLIVFLKKYQEAKNNLQPFFNTEVNIFPDPSELKKYMNEIQNIAKNIPDLFDESLTIGGFKTLGQTKLNELRETDKSLSVLKQTLQQKYHVNVFCENLSEMNVYVNKLRNSNIFSSFLDSKYREAKKLWEKLQKQKENIQDTKIADIFQEIIDNLEQSKLCKINIETYQKFSLLAIQVYENLIRSGLQETIKLSTLFNIIQKIEQINSIKNNICQSNTENLLGYFYQGEKTDSDRLEATLDFTTSVCSSRLTQTIQDELLTTNAAKVISNIQTVLQRLSSLLDEEIKYRQLFFELGKPDLQSMFGSSSILDLSIELIVNRVDRAMDENLSDWINYQRSYHQLIANNLEFLITAFENKELPFSRIVEVYQFVFYRSLLRSVYHDYPELKHLSGISQSQLREQFQREDKRLLELYQKQLVAQLGIVSIAKGKKSGRKTEWTDLALIQNEINKQRRHLPPRSLFQRASISLQQLKPCWMMSPSTVAQFIPPGDIIFDLVIIDEASQMRPEEALGSIARSKQLVVVGDPKQLPPSDFFRSNVAPDDDRDDASNDLDDESILDMSLKVFYPARRLKWHYRSRHESLIAFSNQEFYDNDLTVFPSPNNQFAIEYRYVEEGSYRSSVNIPEAMLVAEAVKNFIQHHPNLSLGIVTLNQKQQQILLDEMDRLFAMNPELEEYRITKENTLEPFFVKNLENVQGDERDVIFISTVYGSERPGMPVMQRFGPINSRNGHRRLNVLFTRAKERIVIFSSMKPSDIRPTPTSHPGVEILQKYLKYAETQQLQTAVKTDRNPDSDFEIFVADRLRKKGYTVVPQVGVSGYFIDLAVVHPQESSTYLLGIECDGATYHSSKSARDRDRLRQQILERLGWRLYRIWSTDWFGNPTGETDKLVSHIELLLKFNVSSRF